MNDSLRTRRRGIAEILVSVVGLVASFVPSFVYTDPFWGVSAFADKGFFETNHSAGVLILGVNAGSPAAAVGLQESDRLITLNGKSVDVGNLRRDMESIHVDQDIVIQVKRGDSDLRLL
jgi:S1-C subfamily serine protease